jgi:hypothetical protein
MKAKEFSLRYKSGHEINNRAYENHTIQARIVHMKTFH